VREIQVRGRRRRPTLYTHKPGYSHVALLVVPQRGQRPGELHMNPGDTTDRHHEKHLYEGALCFRIQRRATDYLAGAGRACQSPDNRDPASRGTVLDCQELLFKGSH